MNSIMAQDTVAKVEKLRGPAYAVSREWLIDALGVDPAQGLSRGDVARRRAEYGPNAIGTARETPWW